MANPKKGYGFGPFVTKETDYDDRGAICSGPANKVYRKVHLSEALAAGKFATWDNDDWTNVWDASDNFLGGAILIDGAGQAVIGVNDIGAAMVAGDAWLLVEGPVSLLTDATHSAGDIITVGVDGVVNDTATDTMNAVAVCVEEVASGTALPAWISCFGIHLSEVDAA